LVFDAERLPLKSGNMTMDPESKKHPLKDFYKDIYRRYDLVNRIFTFGRDKYWRTKAVKECILNNPQSIVDICTGTGDLALEIAEKTGNGIRITGYDFSAEMLEVAREKAEDSDNSSVSPGGKQGSSARGLKNAVSPDENRESADAVKKDKHNCSSKVGSLEFIEGDVAEMPFESGTFDSAGISFGIRNLVYENSNAGKHLTEIHRILRDYGRFVVLESSRPNNAIWRVFNGIYLRFILPYLGGIISGNFKAYRYLAQSSKNYYSKEEMGKILEEAGFRIIRSSSLFMGSVMLLVAEKQPISPGNQN